MSMEKPGELGKKWTEEELEIQGQRDGRKYVQDRDKETGEWLEPRVDVDPYEIDSARKEMLFAKGDATFDPCFLRSDAETKRGWSDIDSELAKILNEKTNEGRSNNFVTIKSETLGSEVKVSWKFRRGFDVDDANSNKHLDWNYLSLDEKKKAVEAICEQPCDELIEKSRKITPSSDEAIAENVEKLKQTL